MRHQIVRHQQGCLFTQDVDHEQQHLIGAICRRHARHRRHQRRLAVKHRLGRGGFQHRHAQLLARDFVFLAVHAQKLRLRERGHVGFRGEKLFGIIGDRDAKFRGQIFGHGTVMRGGGGAAEFERVRQDARQHRAADRFGHLRGIVAHQIIKHGRGAGERADRDLDRRAGLDATCKHVVVDDADHIGVVDRGRQFGGVVGIDDHHAFARRHIGNDFGLCDFPAFEHEGGFGIGLAQQHGACGGAFDLVQIPRPDDGREGGIGIGRFVAKNGNHDMPHKR